MGRSEYYTVKKIGVLDLLLDVRNPRIRHAPDQAACRIAILIEQGPFMNLAKDLAQNGLSIEPILISKTAKNNWIVRDGNRRVAALQMLNDPAVCPKPALKKVFYDTIKNNKAQIPKTIDCVTCDNENEIIKYLRLKHTGENKGIGLKRWDALAQSVFNLGNGHQDQHKRATQFVLWAHQNGIKINEDFPITTLTRLLKLSTISELGFSIKNDKLDSTIDNSIALSRAEKVISDLGSGKVKVDNIFTVDRQDDYAKSVSKAFPVPGSNVTKTQTKTTQTKTTQKAGRRSGAKPSWDRPKLFPKGRPNFDVPYEKIKVNNILNELRNLKTAENPISVAVCFRILVELSIHDYCNRHRMPIKDSLSKNIRAVSEKLNRDGKILQDVNDLVIKYATSKNHILSIETLHKYVHSDHFHPTQETLHSLWDEVSAIIVACWEN